MSSTGVGSLDCVGMSLKKHTLRFGLGLGFPFGSSLGFGFGLCLGFSCWRHCYNCLGRLLFALVLFTFRTGCLRGKNMLLVLFRLRVGR